jgi:hypothetical protein
MLLPKEGNCIKRENYIETLSHFDFLFALASFCTPSAATGPDAPATTAAADMAAAKHTMRITRLPKGYDHFSK